MPNARPAAVFGDIAPFRAPYAPADEGLAVALLESAGRSEQAEVRIDLRATHLVRAIRARVGGLGGVEDLLHAYALSTKEGLALMVLAEALLRVPDAATADRLIEDKLAAGDWAHHEAKSSALLVSASAWALGLSARIIHPGETPETIVEHGHDLIGFRLIEKGRLRRQQEPAAPSHERPHQQEVRGHEPGRHLHGPAREEGPSVQRLPGPLPADDVVIGQVRGTPGRSPRAVRRMFSAMSVARASSIPSVQPETCGVMRTFGSS